MNFQAGLRGRLLWTENYLNGGGERTHVRVAFSNWVNITTDVPVLNFVGDAIPDLHKMIATTLIMSEYICD